MEFRPFLVADRPSALRIIRGAMPDLSASGLGIMTHANVTDNVRGFIQSFPGSGGFYQHNDSFEPDDERRYVTESGELTELGTRIRDRTTIICDSGAFQKEGKAFDDYENLFEQYQSLGVEYGIINDELNNPRETIHEAKNAYETYRQREYDFELVGVAQGTTLDEYRVCYEKQRELGYDKIAIGGLLSKKGDRTGKFAQVSDTAFMEQVIGSIRESYPRAWLFALGCHHPSRHQFFDQLGLAGADYKGWLFKYNSIFNDKLKARKWRFQELRSFLRQNIFLDQSSESASRLLILPLSDIATSGVSLQSARKRTHGPYMGVVRSWQHNVSLGSKDIDLVFVSDRYGLVPGSFQLPPTDARLTDRVAGCPDRALRADIASYLKYRSYDEVLIAGSAEHRERCRPIETVLSINSPATAIDHTSGSLGTQQVQLREWLHTDTGTEPLVSAPPQVR